MNDVLVETYEAALPEYERLRDAAVAHTNALLAPSGLNIHHVTGRVKRPLSLADKLLRKPGQYHTLDEVTDLVAVRVITYFESDVATVSRLVEQAFDVDWEHSIDKSKMHDPDRFGYMGVHYVVRPRPDGTDGSAVPDRQFEIQIRSILQHAWAEIEHDLGYKNRAAVPREVSRRFYRLAGLLEMADEEFMTLHRLSQHYASTLPERVRDTPDSVFIDAQSLTFMMEMPPVRTLDEQVAGALNVLLLTGWPDPERPQRLATLLQYVGVNSVGALQKELRRHGSEIVAFAAELMPRLRDVWFPVGGVRPGTSVVHFALMRACANPSLNPQEIVQALDLSSVRATAHLVDTVRATYAEVTRSRAG
ncbi:GTP pyrophosphokinase family protein [Deinococcus sp. KSM4-11]|uniref:GTP pyrophosphokinase n=1 Tax=Deinococcus sp. KSM4-11 TaxID=2568654 RepID=UPI0010A4B589|nr:GTP pyrophosphokinase family protein [Deinococcus sp. KSM4-11]THF88748.1 GTP pyrophosphokinase family protein [Deinococcus sp. KSM4-11]